MAYQTSDTSKIHSTALDAKLVLSNPTEEWTLKNNVVNNNFVLESQTLPNILNIDRTTGFIDAIDVIKSTQSTLKSNTAFSTNLLSSLGMVASYDIIFPPTPPTANQAFVFDGVNYIWSGAPLTSSPAFEAYHTADFAIFYGVIPYDIVLWDDIIQNSTDVTYNVGTGVFTVNVEADYQVEYSIYLDHLAPSYFAEMRDEITTTFIARELSVTHSWEVGVLNPITSGVSNPDFLWHDWPSTRATISRTVHLAIGQTFTLGVRVDPTYATITNPQDSILYNLDTSQLSFCSIKRV
jgi:hypothetical protein